MCFTIISWEVTTSWYSLELLCINLPNAALSETFRPRSFVTLALLDHSQETTNVQNSGRIRLLLFFKKKLLTKFKRNDPSKSLVDEMEIVLKLHTEGSTGLLTHVSTSYSCFLRKSL